MTPEQFQTADPIQKQIQKLKENLLSIDKSGKALFYDTRVYTDDFYFLKPHFEIFKKYSMKAFQKEIERLEEQLKNI